MKRISRTKTTTAGFLFLSGVVLFVVLPCLIPLWTKQPFTPSPRHVAPQEKTVEKHTVFSHSITQGGVWTPAQAGLPNGKAVMVLADMFAFVSYRGKDGKVYWTRHKVRIRAGETLFTDGITTIRAICGNAVSMITKAPFEDADVADSLDVPEVPTGDGVVFTSSIPETPPTATGPPTTGDYPAPPTGLTGCVDCGRFGPPPVRTPEPAVIWFVFLAIVVLSTVSYWRVKL